MYIPAHFAENRQEELFGLIRSHPFGTLVTQCGGRLDANHLPFELDDGIGAKGMLRAHVARANPVWTEVQNGAEVLVVFQGQEAYVSPSWYPSKQELHKQVPTWNYRVVHAHGRITFFDDERYVRGVVARLTRTHESTEAKPWKMTDAPPEFIDRMLKAIVGVEIEITDLVGKFKLGQNREPRDRQNAGDVLISRGNTELGQAMQETIK